MLNNQNLLSHSPNDQAIFLKKKIEIQSQKSHSHDQKIKQLKARIQATKQRTQQKRQKLVQVQQRVLQQKQKGDHFKNNLSSENHASKNQSSNQSSSLLQSNQSSIIEQLRQHFKALRHQMLSQVWGQDQGDDEYYDEVDVDNMTYEELLELGDKIGKVSKGLDMKKMSSLEVKKYHNSIPNEHTDCAICRQQLQQGTDCIQLHCKHVFHDQCIKGWLNVQKHCPNCKREIKTGGSDNK